MGRIKYVIVKEAGFEIPILFSHLMEHSRFRHWGGGDKVVSAGFVGVYNKKMVLSVSVWGKSDSLNIASRPEDAEIIKQSLFREEY